MNKAKTQQIINTEDLPGHKVVLGADRPMPLNCGKTLGPFTMAYQTYGKLNAAKSNAILICHALTGDQFVAETHPVTGKPGWWSQTVGPGKAVDTDRYFVICSNILGSCMGTAGPTSINPQTGRLYGLDFPFVTIGDMVRAQKLLIDHLGIEKLFCVIGPSMGGMQALEWAVRYPERLQACALIATTAKHSAQNIAFHEASRQAIMADPDWCNGDYINQGKRPSRGLAVARMTTHVTYLSEDSLHEKFGRSLQDRPDFTYGFDADFQIESYLRHQGISFVERFDANSFLYITKAINYFDMVDEFHGNLAEAFHDTPVKFCVVSFSTDWLFPTSESRTIVHALNTAGASVSFVEIDSNKGHDAFLLNEPQFHNVLSGFLEGSAGHLCESAAPSPCRPPLTPGDVRVDFQLIADMVEPNARVLDVGCCDGELLAFLQEKKNARGMGIELGADGVRAGVARGLSIVQGDADEDLKDYPSKSFDYAILSNTLQAMKDPRDVLLNLTRIGKYAVVSFPNFGHWRIRADLFFRGRMPVNEAIPYQWWDTPNIHFCTIADFMRFCKELDITVHSSLVLDSKGRLASRTPSRFANLFGEQAVFLLSKNKG